MPPHQSEHQLPPRHGPHWMEGPSHTRRFNMCLMVRRDGRDLCTLATALIAERHHIDPRCRSGLDVVVSMSRSNRAGISLLEHNLHPHAPAFVATRNRIMPQLSLHLRRCNAQHDDVLNAFRSTASRSITPVRQWTTVNRLHSTISSVDAPLLIKLQLFDSSI